MFATLGKFLGLIRFSHTVFALPFALTSAALAWKHSGRVTVVEVVGILLCMVTARSAAMAFNRLVDRQYDAANPRTAGRHLPAGQLSVAAVASFTVLSAAAFVASTALFLLQENPWPILLAVPVLGFLLAYSLTKRFTALCHFWLGVSLFLAPVAAWIAIRGLPGWPELLEPLLLGGAVLFWVAGFDILYATQDIDFDRQARLQSVPAALGLAGALRVAQACHLVMLALLLALFFLSPHLHHIYLVGLVAIAALLGYEHWLVSPHDLSRVNEAFFRVNAVISLGLFAVVLVQLALGI